MILPRSSRVSVIVPFEGSTGGMRAAFRSLAAQTQRPLEIVVVARAQDAAASLRLARESLGSDVEVKLVGWPRSGSSPLHEGALRSRGEFVAFIEAGARYRPERLASLQQLSRQTGAGLVLSRVVHCGPDGKKLASSRSQPLWYELAWSVRHIYPTLGFGMLAWDLAVCASNLFFSREIYLRTAGFTGAVAHLGLGHRRLAAQTLLHTEPAMAQQELIEVTVGESGHRVLEPEALSAAGAEILNAYLVEAMKAPPRNPVAPCPRYWPGRFGQYLGIRTLNPMRKLHELVDLSPLLEQPPGDLSEQLRELHHPLDGGGHLLFQSRRELLGTPRAWLAFAPQPLDFSVSLERNASRLSDDPAVLVTRGRVEGLPRGTGFSLALLDSQGIRAVASIRQGRLAFVTAGPLPEQPQFVLAEFLGTGRYRFHPMRAAARQPSTARPATRLQELDFRVGELFVYRGADEDYLRAAGTYAIAAGSSPPEFWLETRGRSLPLTPLPWTASATPKRPGVQFQVALRAFLGSDEKVDFTIVARSSRETIRLVTFSVFRRGASFDVLRIGSQAASRGWKGAHDQHP